MLRVWADADLHAAGLVVGEAERPLDLYVLLDGSTVSYTTVTPAPQGTPFHIIAGKPPALGRAAARVDLVYGAVIWYTAERECEAPPGETPAAG